MLFNLAEAADVAGKRAAMFTGEKINNTEGRAVMHVALRAPKDAVSGSGGSESPRSPPPGSHARLPPLSFLACLDVSQTDGLLTVLSFFVLCVFAWLSCPSSVRWFRVVKGLRVER